MKEIWNGFLNLENYSAEIIVFVAELLAAVFLLEGYIRLHYSRKKQKLRKAGKAFSYEMLAENSGSVQIVLRRKDACAVYATENLEEVLGISPEKLYSDIEQLGMLLEPAEYRSLLRQYQNWDGKEKLTAEVQLSKSRKWIQLWIGRSQDGKYDFFTGIDVTALYEEREELTERIRKAEENSQSKSTFLSRMSHEIRTPMNGIMGMLTLAKKSIPEESPAVVYLEKAETLSKHLLLLINDILDMSRIEAGKMELEQAEFDVYELAGKLRDMFQKNVEAKGVAFQVDVVDCKDRYLLGDELRLSQVLINILSNAQKFTSQGEITVTIRQMMHVDKKADYMFKVHDTGIGMSTEFVSRIFKPFEQESNYIAKNYGGTGLGMAITDQIVRLMSGEIVIETRQGAGTDFMVYLTFPVSEKEAVSPETKIVAAETEKQEEPEFSYQGKRILVAEDNAINAEITVSVLEMEGAEAEVAENGKEAVEKFTKNPAGYYDFILMDIQMPIMNGWDASLAIRAMDRPDAKEIPIFALSADAYVEEKRHSLEIGVDGHFSKPIDFEEMKKEIGRVWREKGRR